MTHDRSTLAMRKPDGRETETGSQCVHLRNVITNIGTEQAAISFARQANHGNATQTKCAQRQAATGSGVAAPLMVTRQ